jgi:hypothetical protein
MYASAQQAADAAARLKSIGFTDDQISLVTPANSGSDPEAIIATIMAGYVLKSHAGVYAERVRGGASLVSVVAPFGMGGEATQILDSFDPIESGVPEARDTAKGWDDSAPISSALRIPTLVKGDPTFSGFWSMPVLARNGRTLCSLLGIPEISGSGKTTFGGGLLTDSALSLSSKLGLPLLLSSGSRR